MYPDTESLEALTPLLTEPLRSLTEISSVDRLEDNESPTPTRRGCADLTADFRTSMNEEVEY